MEVIIYRDVKAEERVYHCLNILKDSGITELPKLEPFERRIIWNNGGEYIILSRNENAYTFFFRTYEGRILYDYKSAEFIFE